jgi:hypothetical protein
MRKTKYRGLAGVAAGFLLNLIGYNLIRIWLRFQQQAVCMRA